jgi:translation initiation factor 2 subunit 2
MSDLPVFDPTMKKKKKKKRATKVPAAEVAEPSEDVVVEQDEETSAKVQVKAEDVAAATAMFGAKKKKKKSVAFSDENDDSTESSESSDMTAAKSESSSSSSSSASSSAVSVAGDSGSAWVESDRDYQYEELVDRVFKLIENFNPDMMNRGRDQRVRMPPPEVFREGTRRTVWANFAAMADAINRKKDHLQTYALAELGTTGTLDSEDRLTIRGRFQPKQIQTVVRHYIGEYVICKTCKSPDTELRKENRMYFLTCSHCGSARSVAAIKTGFVAQVGRRKRA